MEIIDPCEAAGLLGSQDATRVTGVRVVERDGGAERELTADLVVDATGRGGRAIRWLADLGYEPPREDRAAVDIKYVSRSLCLPPTPAAGAGS